MFQTIKSKERTYSQHYFMNPETFLISLTLFIRLYMDTKCIADYKSEKVFTSKIHNLFQSPDKNSWKTQFEQQNCLNCTRKRFLTMPSWAEYYVNRLVSLKKSSAQAKRDYALIQSISESDSTGKAFHCF